jgi:hypothetical protein
MHQLHQANHKTGIELVCAPGMFNLGAHCFIDSIENMSTSLLYDFVLFESRCYNNERILPRSVEVAQGTLDPFAQVRILARQPLQKHLGLMVEKLDVTHAESENETNYKETNTDYSKCHPVRVSAYQYSCDHGTG